MGAKFLDKIFCIRHSVPFLVNEVGSFVFRCDVSFSNYVSLKLYFKQ